MSAYIVTIRTSTTRHCYLTLAATSFGAYMRAIDQHADEACAIAVMPA